jgi:protein SCO1/2
MSAWRLTAASALMLAAAAMTGVACARESAVSAAHPEQGVGFDQHLDARLPAGLRFTDEHGGTVTLGRALGGKPAVLVLGYLECRDLCPMTLMGVTEALSASGLGPRDYRAVFVDIDPREKPAALAARRQRIEAGDRPAWEFLAGDTASVANIARAVGFRYRYDSGHGIYAHPAGFVVATPEGRISRYFFGVRYDPGELATALRDAGQGETGRLAQRLVLLCYHFDPLTGRYTLTVLGVLRAVIAVFLGLALAWAWRQWRAGRAR